MSAATIKGRLLVPCRYKPTGSQNCSQTFYRIPRSCSQNRPSPAPYTEEGSRENESEQGISRGIWNLYTRPYRLDQGFHHPGHSGDLVCDLCYCLVCFEQRWHSRWFHDCWNWYCVFNNNAGCSAGRFSISLKGKCQMMLYVIL